MTLPLLIGTGLINYMTLRAFMWLIDYVGLYKLKHEDTAWHSTLGGADDDEFGVPRWDELDKIKGASHEAYLMNQKITSETFRFRFLRYNRPWLVNQLPNILRLTSIYQGYTTTTAINRHVVGKYHLRVISIQTGILN